MKLAAAFGNIAPDDVGPLLGGGVLKIHSVARPTSPNAPATRSGLLATFQFGTRRSTHPRWSGSRSLRLRCHTRFRAGVHG